MIEAGLYLRISDDREGLAAGVSRQEQDCRTLARLRGWTVASTYTENDTSAFKRRKVALPDGTTALRVVRPEFRRMLDDLAHGRISAIIGYDLDRVARDPRDLEDLIDVAETTRHPVVSVTGNLDLSHDGGITMARIAVAIANQASRDTSRRVRRAKEAAAAEGKWLGGGSRAYGWTRDRSAVVPEEAAIVREIADRVLAGTPMRTIIADLRDRQVPTALGRQWEHGPVLRMITRPAMVGLLERRGEVTGPAPWPAILDRETWEALRALAAQRSRHDTTLRWWLTQVIRCARCGTLMRGNGGAYKCQAAQGGCGQITVTGRGAHEMVGRAVLARLTTAPPPRVSARRPPVDDSALVDLATMWGSGELSLAEYRAAKAAALQRIRADQGPEPVRLPAWARPEDLMASWEAWGPSQRQQVAGALLEAVVVHPGAASKRFSPERLELRWR